MEENPLWLVVLCDMMTNLMLFFLVMFALTRQSDRFKEQFLRKFDANGVIADPSQSNSDDAVKEFREAEAARNIRALLGTQKGLEGAIEVSESEDVIRVRLLNKVLFQTSKAGLDEQAQKTVALLAHVLRQMENTVIVEGHTDSVPVRGGLYRSNWELSVARSYAIIERLIGEGVAPARLVAAGYGEFHPVAGNDTEEGRARNRRVDILILRKAEELDQDGGPLQGRKGA